MASGSVFTVTVADEEHPVALKVKDIKDVPPPVATPVTNPDELIVATDGLMLLHVPAPEASLSVIVAPVHTLNEPELEVMGRGAGITFAVVTAAQPVTGSV